MRRVSSFTAFHCSHRLHCSGENPIPFLHASIEIRKSSSFHRTAPQNRLRGSSGSDEMISDSTSRIDTSFLMNLFISFFSRNNIDSLGLRGLSESSDFFLPEKLQEREATNQTTRREVKQTEQNGGKAERRRTPGSVFQQEEENKTSPSNQLFVHKIRASTSLRLLTP